MFSNLHDKKKKWGSSVSSILNYICKAENLRREYMNITWKVESRSNCKYPLKRMTSPRSKDYATARE